MKPLPKASALSLRQQKKKQESKQTNHTNFENFSAMIQNKKEPLRLGRSQASHGNQGKKFATI
jgi:hypothetical protein